jgi:2-polyprenyl-3-methyl-5-hydroxy-6-metoxy-1,4-benzoquinol methylase
MLCLRHGTTRSPTSIRTVGQTVYDDPVIESLFELLGAVAGQRVLDVACGRGCITRELARRGAEAVGLDVSLVLIEKARSIERDECLGVPYVHSDIGSWKSSDSSFDAVSEPKA